MGAAWHGSGTAWERHGMRELAFMCYMKTLNNLIL
jgi:hypothetical protein